MEERNKADFEQHLLRDDLIFFVKPSTFWSADDLVESAWLEHIPFAFWLIDAWRPRCFVELGTHHGASYLAFCQAVKRLHVGTRCYAVDTWEGDTHAGLYGDEVFSSLSEVHQTRYGAFSALIRSTFDDAAPYFEDQSIDLLHIDGLHTYEAVRHDFETWRPKLTERAIVIFHDTNVREREFGVGRFWREVKQGKPHFEFLHGHGLGILGLGSEYPSPVSALFSAEESPEKSYFVRSLFARLGAEVLLQFRFNTAKREVEHLSSAVTERDAHINESFAALQRQKAETDKLTNEVWSRDQRLVELNTLYSVRQSQLERVNGELAAREERVRALEAALHEANAQTSRLSEGLARANAERDETRDALHKAKQEAEQARRALLAKEHEIAQVKSTAATQQREASAALVHERQRAQQHEREFYELRDRLKSMKRNPAWRATKPLRWAVRDKNGAAAKRRKPLKRLKRAVLKRFLPTSTPLVPVPSADSAVRIPAIDRTTLALAKVKDVVRPKVVFVSGEPDTPGHYYRVENMAGVLAPRFYETAIVRLDELPARFSELTDASVVWIWRAAWCPAVESVLAHAKRHEIRVIFDIDDLMVRPELAVADIIDGIRTNNLPEEIVADHYKRIQMVLSQSDHGTCPTDTLASELRRLAMPATVIPNGFDHRVLERAVAAHERRLREPDDGLIRIGYAAGSKTHQKDIAVAMKAITKVLKETPEARLVLFIRGAQAATVAVEEFPELEPFIGQIEWRDYVPVAELVDEYARFDINIAPLEVGNRFCEAKSELKFFEAALVGVPTIASPTQPFVSCIRHKQTGFLAYNEADWQQYLTELVAEPELRRRIAANAYGDVLWRYGAERRGVLVRRLIDRVLAPPAVHAELFRVGIADELDSEPKAVPATDFDIVYQSPGRVASRVSIVIPLYNYAHYVVEALESVKAQTYRAIDVVVVEDRSTDDSLAVAERWLKENEDYFNYVALIRNRDNSRLPRSRNNGILFSKTEFILPLDADNVLLPTCVARCVELLDQTGAAVAFPTIQRFGDETGVVSEREWDPARLRFGNYIDAMAMFRKACWLAVGGYGALDLGWEDYDLWCKFIERGFWGARVPEVTARYRVHGTSMRDTLTDLDHNKVKISEELTRRHPWLDPVQWMERAHHPARLFSEAAPGRTIGTLEDALR